MALFDAVVNNADRKGGHVLVRRATAALYGVDHGVCFHVEDKLRTVLWGWAGRPLPADAVEVLDGAAPGSSTARSGDELARAPDRSARSPHVGAGSTGCCDAGRFPQPPQDWPAVPWPPM